LTSFLLLLQVLLHCLLCLSLLIYLLFHRADCIICQLLLSCNTLMGYLQQKLQMVILQGVLPDLPCLQDQNEKQDKSMKLSLQSQIFEHPGIAKVPSNAKYSAPHCTLTCKRNYTAPRRHKL